MAKADGAFLTIGGLATELGVPQHVLRYWETRFPQLKPLQRAGNRRYYRTADVALARRINHLLNAEGYTVRGVQQLLDAEPADKAPARQPTPPPAETPASEGARDELMAIRAMLAQALAEDA